MPPKKMTTEHKQALADGRAEGRAVKSYLDALEQQKPRRGRKRTPDSIAKRLTAIEKQLADASSLQRTDEVALETGVGPEAVHQHLDRKAHVDLGGRTTRRKPR